MSGLQTESDSEIIVSRHRTALSRSEFSLPVRMLLAHGFFSQGETFFDYGCGRGGDVARLLELGVEAAGWDPMFFPDVAVRMADIVNLGYVLNVIEDPIERSDAVQKSFEMAKQLLVVSVMVDYGRRDKDAQQFGDGVLTQRGTFQRYFAQSEINEYLKEHLARTAIVVAPGVALLFKEAIDEQVFLLSRQQVRRRWRSLRIRSDHQVAQLSNRLRSVCDEVRDQWIDLGRQPSKSEVSATTELATYFGNWPKAMRFIGAQLDQQTLTQAAVARYEDLLVYFALNAFEKRTAFRVMPNRLRNDVKHYFGKISLAHQQSRELLFSAGDPAQIHVACIQALEQRGIGLLTDDHDLQFHRSLLSDCPALIRVYVGCALHLYGDIELTDVIKVHIQSGKVTFLRYDDFEGRRIPLLLERVKVRLRDLRVDYYDYGVEYEPQPLFPKSSLMALSDPHRARQMEFEARYIASRRPEAGVE